MMMYISFFFTITLLLYAIVVFRQDRARKTKQRIYYLTDKDFKNHGKDEETSGPSALQTALNSLWRKLKRGFARRMPEEQEEKMALKLLRAGNPLGLGPVEFRILQLSLSVGLPVIFIIYGMLIRAGAAGIILCALLGLGIAILLPSYYLSAKTKKRSRLALRELPDVLDMLTVSLEAGLGFDGALSKLISKSNGVLASEFHRCLEEIRLGKTRREALLGVRERLVLDEIKVVISSILQAEKLGIGMVQVLRVQSQEVREQRKQRAEEEAMKAPIKMLFPLVLFIFPSLFVVVLGPAVIQIIGSGSFLK